MFLIACVTTLYFILPAYFSNGSGLVFGGGTPVDFGKSDEKGNRWIGDGVTWRGFIAGTIIGTLTGAVQGYFGPELMQTFGQYIITPIATDLHSGIMIGFLLGFGALLGIIHPSDSKYRCLSAWYEGCLVLIQIPFHHNGCSDSRCHNTLLVC